MDHPASHSIHSPGSGTIAQRSVATRPLHTRRRRRTRQLAWEQTELASRGAYAQNFETVCSKCPDLSIMEARVCALVGEALPNWKIGEILGISERTVEGHLRSIRKKLGLPPGTKMHREIEHRLALAAA